MLQGPSSLPRGSSQSAAVRPAYEGDSGLSPFRLGLNAARTYDRGTDRALLEKRGFPFDSTEPSFGSRAGRGPTLSFPRADAEGDACSEDVSNSQRLVGASTMRNAAEVGPASASRLEASSLNRQPLDRSAGAGESDAATRESGTAAGVRTSRFLASRYERGVDVEVGARVGTRSVYAEEGFRAAGFSVTIRPLRGDASRGALEDSKLVPAGVPSSGSAFLQVSGRDSTSPESARAAGGMNVSDRQAGLDDRGRDFGSARSTFSPSAAASRRQLYSFVSVSRSSSQHATALASRSPLHGLEKFSTTKDSALRALTSALTPHHREDLRHGLASQVEGNGALGTSGRPETQGAMRDANLLSSSALGDSDPIRLELGEDRENKNASSRLLNCDDLTSSAELSATALRSRAPVETRRLPADGASHFATSFSRSTVFQGSSGGALGDASSRVAGSRAVARERVGAPAAAGRSVDAARELPAEDEALFSPESSVRLRAQQPATFSSQLEVAAKMHANAAGSCSREGSPAFLPSSASHAPFAAQSALGVSSSRPSFLEERHRDKASDSFLSSSLRSGTPSGAPLDAMERSSPARVHAFSSLLRTSSSSSFSSVSQRPFSLAAAASAAHSRRTDALLLGGRAPRTAAGKEEGRENEEGGADRFASTGLGETAAAEAPTGSARTGSGGYMSHLLLPSFPSLHRERADKAADDMLQRKEEGDMRSCSMQEKDKDASVSSHSLSSAAGRRGHGGAATTRSFSQPAAAATQPASSQLSHRSRYVDRSVTQPPLSSAAEEGARSPAFLPLSLEGCESAAARAFSSSSVGARSEELFVGGPRERERSLGGGVPGRKEDAVSSAAPGATARPPSGAAGTNSLSRFATATESGESVGGISTRTPPSSVLSSRAPPSSVSRLGEEPLDAGDKAAALFPFSAADQRRASQQSSRSAMSFHLSAENGGAGGLVSKTSSVSLLVGNAGAGKLETAAGKGSTVCVCQASRYMARQKAHYEQQLKRVEEERQQQQQRRRILAEQETQVSLLQTQVQRQREGVTEEEKQLREMRSQLTEEREAMERRWQQLEKQHQDLVEKKEKWRQTAQHKRDELQAFSQRIRAEKKELDDRKKEIARDTANLKERSESVEREQDNLNRQRVELEEVRFSLDRAKAELDARISATDDERRRVKKREEEVLRRGEDLQTKEEELGRERLEVEKRQEALALKADEDERRELERDSLWRKKNEELDRRTRAVHEQEKEMDARSHELRRQEAELKREEDREKKLQQLQEAFLEEQKNFAREKGRIEAELEEEKKRTEEERRRDEAEREQARKRIENERKSFELFLEEERARWDAERRRAEGEFEEAQRVWNQERKSREADLAAAQESVAKRAEELEKEEKQKREDFEAMTMEFQKEKEKITRQLEAEQEQMREELGREREQVVEEKRRAQEDLERTRKEFEAEKSREMQELHDQMERLKEKQAELEALQERWEAERLAVEARLREEQERLEGERQVLAQERDAFEEEVHRERAQFREEREAALAELQAQRRLAERELGEQKAQQEDVFEEERQRLMQVEEKQQETYAEQMKQLRNLEEEVHQQKLHHQQDVSRHLSREEALFERERRMREEEQSVQEERQRLTKEKQEIAHQRRQLEDEQSKQKEMEAALRREREDVEKKTEALREQMEQVAQVDEKFARAREAENALEIERAALEAEKESFSREKELIDAQVGAWRRKLSQREQEVSRREREASTRLRDIETQERVHKVRMEEEAAAGRGFARHTRAGSASSSRRGSTAAQREVRGLWPDGDTKKAGSSSRTRTRFLSVERRQAGRTPSNASASGIPLPKSVAARRHLTPVGGDRTAKKSLRGSVEAADGRVKTGNDSQGKRRRAPLLPPGEGADEQEAASEDSRSSPWTARGRSMSAASGDTKRGTEEIATAAKRDGVSQLLPALRGGRSPGHAGTSTRASSVTGERDDEAHERETDRRPNQEWGTPAWTSSSSGVALSGLHRGDRLASQRGAPSFSGLGSATGSLSRKGQAASGAAALASAAKAGEDERESTESRENGADESPSDRSRSLSTRGVFSLSQALRAPFAHGRGVEAEDGRVNGRDERGERRHTREDENDMRENESMKDCRDAGGQLVFQNIFQPSQSASPTRENFSRISHLPASRQSCSSSALSHPCPSSSSPARGSPEKAASSSASSASSSSCSPYSFSYSSFLKTQGAAVGEREEATKRISNADRERQDGERRKQYSSASPPSMHSTLSVSPVSLDGLSLGTLERSGREKSQPDWEGQSPRRGTAASAASEEKTAYASYTRMKSASPAGSSSLAPQVSQAMERSAEDAERRDRERGLSVGGAGSSNLFSRTPGRESGYGTDAKGIQGKRLQGDLGIGAGTSFSGRGDVLSHRESLPRTSSGQPRAQKEEGEEEGRRLSQTSHYLQSPRSRQAWKDRLAAACAPTRTSVLPTETDEEATSSPLLRVLRDERSGARNEGGSSPSSYLLRRSLCKSQGENEGRLSVERKSSHTYSRRTEGAEAAASGPLNARESVISHLSAFNVVEDSSDYGGGENSLSGLESSSGRLSSGRGRTSLSGR